MWALAKATSSICSETTAKTSFTDCLSHLSMPQKSVADAYGDLNMRSLAKGDVIQLERKGYWIVDEAADATNPQKVVQLLLLTTV